MKIWSFATSVLRTLTLGTALAATVPVVANELPYYDSPEFTPRWFDPNDASLRAFHRIPAFSFTNQHGATVSEQSVAGKIYVASFFFSTCPGICPAIRSKLARIQAQYPNDRDVLILSHSIRPSTDTPAVLRAYAKANDVTSRNWHLLTGDKAQTYHLAKSAYFANEDLGNVEKQDDFLHTENLLLIDSERRIRGVYNGLSASSVNNLLSDIRALKETMPKSRRSSPRDSTGALAHTGP
ncbi:MAG: SCO family protein [Gammaproteobacteria bacterium]